MESDLQAVVVGRRVELRPVDIRVLVLVKEEEVHVVRGKGREEREERKGTSGIKIVWEDGKGGRREG